MRNYQAQVERGMLAGHEKAQPKSCPFCGGPGQAVDDGGNIAVYCRNCGSRGTVILLPEKNPHPRKWTTFHIYQDMTERAIAAWNRRTP